MTNEPEGAQDMTWIEPIWTMERGFWLKGEDH
jgi:hypothetical protein